MSCDESTEGLAGSVQPFDDSVFVAGFVLLICAILCIGSILIWYCCWFKQGFHPSTGHMAGTSIGMTADMDDDDDEDDGGRMDHETRMR